MPYYKIHTFPSFSDLRGTLIPFELNQAFPFAVKRVYLVTANTKQTRGGHAHKIESELFVAAHGSIKVRLNVQGQEEVILLNQKNQALEVSPYCWHEFYDFSADAVLLCFSSTHYLPGEENYIADKTEFLSLYEN